MTKCHNISDILIEALLLIICFVSPSNFIKNNEIMNQSCF